MEIPYHPPAKYSVTINGHQTSISLEPYFWELLRSLAERRHLSVNALVATIDAERIKSPTPPGLAGAIRIWLVHQES
jgi:predicted DNA-binding ribbon-helix-helix protein